MIDEGGLLRSCREVYGLSDTIENRRIDKGYGSEKWRLESGEGDFCLRLNLPVFLS